MKKFLTTSILFLVIGVLFGEIVVRAFDLTIDVAESYQAKNKLMKFYPNQEGKYKRGAHTWKINEYGFAGTVPDNWDNLILILGDSYIENFMNPVSCHQDVYLKQMLPQYNYFEAGRSGAAIVEMFELSKELDTLKPKMNLFYLGSNDFIECLSEMKKSSQVKYDAIKNKLIFGKDQSSRLKSTIYKFKFAYYIYRNIWLAKNSESGDNTEVFNKEIPEKSINKLLSFLKENYITDDKIFIFRPGSDKKVVDLCQKAGFKTYFLQGDLSKWKLENDTHWSCYGHEQAAMEVVNIIKENLSE